MKFFLLTFSALILLFLGSAGTVDAQFNSDVQLNNYAWSSNIGWISFNGPGYGVVIEPDGDLVGYAWSSNIGWIKFGGLSGYPGGGEAEIDLSTSKVSGWARACAGTINGDCSTMTDHPDGWDGWISLHCDNTEGGACTSYGVSVSSGALSGYGWGDDVVGWITFSGVTFTPPCSPVTQCLVDLSGYEQTNQWCEVDGTTTNCPVGTLCDINNPGTCVNSVMDGTVLAKPAVTRVGKQVDVTWSSTNTSSCTLQQTNLDGTVLQTWDGTDGTISSEPIDRTNVFNLVCTDIAGLNSDDVASTTVRHTPDLIEI